MPVTVEEGLPPAFEAPAPAGNFSEWGLLFLNLVVITITAAALWLGWRSEVKDAEQRVQASGTLMAFSVGDKLDKVAVAADALANRLEAEMRAGGINRDALWSLVDRSLIRLGEAQTLAIFDAAGQQACGVAPVERCRRINVADRPFFRAARDQAGADFRLHGPLESRMDGQQVLMLARPLHGPDGAFAGLVMALLPVAKLRGLLQTASSGDGSVASLRSADMALLVRDPPLPAGAQLGSVSSALIAELARQPDGGLYRAVTASDGIDRITYYRRVQGWPVVVLVGRASTEALATWRIAMALALVFIAALAVGSVLLARATRKQGAQARRAQHLYETAPCGYHTLDALGRFVSINRTELAWLGWPADQLVGQRSPRDFFSPKSQQTFDENFPKLRDRGRLDNLELDLIARDGRVRRVVVSAVAVVDAKGQFMGSNSVMHDVTALHSAQNELAARADEQRAMLDNEIVGMVKVRAGSITWTNRGMDQIFGYAPGEMAGMSIAKIFFDEALYQRTAARIGALQYKVGLFREDQELRRKDGSPVWVDVSTVKIDPSGRESFTIAKDISDRKLAEVRRLRTAELEAQNLALQEAGRLKDEFLSNLSHELRTPLNAVNSFAYLLGMNKVVAEVPKLASHVRHIEESGKHLLELIQTMLDFAKNESGKLQFKPSHLFVVDALNEVAGILEVQRLDAGVEMTVAVEPGLDMVVNDPLRLRQMLLNLLGNAIKFSRRGGTVRLEARALDGEHWCAVVTDEGIGIAAEDLPRLFARFVQLSAGSTKAYGGVGLGLALVRSIARAQGGDVQVESELDKGSVFTLTLPRSLPGEDAMNSGFAG